MKTKNFLTKTLLLAVALLAGSSTMWADVTPIPIPQNMGNYIPLSTDNGVNFESYITTHDGCSLDNKLSSGNNYYTIGNTSGATATIAIKVNVHEGKAGDYVFGFKTGSDNGTSNVAITLTKSGGSPINIATEEPVIQNGGWDPVISHVFYIRDMEEADYTITLTATKKSGSYCGNFGLFYFHQVTQYPSLPTSGSIEDESTHIDLSDGTYYKSKYNSDKVISDLDNGGYMDYILVNNNVAGYYNLFLNVKDKKTNDGTLTATIYDVKTGTTEATGNINVTAEGNQTISLFGALSTGLKRIRFDFTGTKTNGTIFNYQKVTTAITKYALNENYNYTPVAAENVDIVLTRTINAGNWSTIVLPFDMTAEQVTTTFGENVKLAQFTAYDSDKKEVTMSEATTMNANEPYMIKVAQNEYNSPVTIEGVTIVAATPAKTISSVTFQGVYESGYIEAGDYYVKNNQLFKATGTQTIKPFRAYFTGVPAEARLMFFDDETTSIANVDVKANDNFDANAPIFNLAGQRVGKNYKGVVIQNSKKYILK